MRLSPVSKKLRRPVQFKNTAKILKRHCRWRHIQDVLSFLSLCFNRALLALFDTVNYAIENLRQLAVMLSSCYQNLIDSGILKNKREIVGWSARANPGNQLQAYRLVIIGVLLFRRRPVKPGCFPTSAPQRCPDVLRKKNLDIFFVHCFVFTM